MILLFHSLHTSLHVSRFSRLSREIKKIISSKMWSGNASDQSWFTNLLYLFLGYNFELTTPILFWKRWIDNCESFGEKVFMWFCWYESDFALCCCMESNKFTVKKLELKLKLYWEWVIYSSEWTTDILWRKPGAWNLSQCVGCDSVKYYWGSQLHGRKDTFFWHFVLLWKYSA